ncbi:hypothetical protein ACGFNX_34435 [Streptomyces sp. NPDC048723]|uniref:hypothetical protein n=1 Tax=Streptomyces sp. NPDC048723 TaxID=3365589 RepID=UPI00372383A8
MSSRDSRRTSIRAEPSRTAITGGRPISRGAYRTVQLPAGSRIEAKAAGAGLRASDG